MAGTKKLVCLANSRKHSGRCIAGKEVLDEGYGPWIRPVSARQTAEISEEERRYQDGVLPTVLDVMTVPIIGPAPHLYQAENVVIDAGRYWVKDGELPWSAVEDLVDRPTSVWTSGESSYYGLNDRVRLQDASELCNSLMLIKPDALSIEVVTEGAEFHNPRRKVRASFTYHDTHYLLNVTDPAAEKSLLAMPNAVHPMRNTYLCISLGEVFTDGYCYKLVAAVINEEGLVT